MAGSPKDAYGMVRYALPCMRRGTLQVGSDAPDVRLVALDGIDRFHIRERLGRRPLVLAFGRDRKSTRLNSSHLGISYAVFCLKKKKKNKKSTQELRLVDM